MLQFTILPIHQLLILIMNFKVMPHSLVIINLQSLVCNDFNVNVLKCDISPIASKINALLVN